MSCFLVTGGAGYVGSHLVLALCDAGHEVVVLDNLSLGHRAAVPVGVRLVRADIGDIAAVDRLLSEGGWEAVFHFAALSEVPQSMAQPYRYLLENAAAGIRLIEACVRRGVGKFILSSTASVFGAAADIPIAEDAPTAPGSPYGESKLMLERALYWADRVDGMRSACLRYFNAAGADPGGRAGEDHRPESHLIPLAIDAALGRVPALTLFGTDYRTPDGTCIRDFVHVTDLAAAHLAVLERLDHASVTYNVGTGTGHSVRAVIDAVAKASGRAVPVRRAGRRPGDPPALVASPARLIAETGWKPCHPALDEMVATTLAWRAAHPNGYPD